MINLLNKIIVAFLKNQKGGADAVEAEIPDLEVNETDEVETNEADIESSEKITIDSLPTETPNTESIQKYKRTY